MRAALHDARAAQCRGTAGRVCRRREQAHPTGRRAEPKIVDLLDALWADSRTKSKGTIFDAYLAQHFDRVRQGIAETLAVLHEPAARLLAEVIIHSDYHPGDLKFEGEEITGLVDLRLVEDRPAGA